MDSEKCPLPDFSEYGKGLTRLISYLNSKLIIGYKTSGGATCSSSWSSVKIPACASPAPKP